VERAHTGYLAVGKLPPMTLCVSALWVRQVVDSMSIPLSESEWWNLAVASTATFVAVFLGFFLERRLEDRRNKATAALRSKDLEQLQALLANEVAHNLETFENVRQNAEVHLANLHGRVLSSELWSAARTRLAELGAAPAVLARYGAFYGAVGTVRESLAAAKGLMGVVDPRVWEFIDHHRRRADRLGRGAIALVGDEALRRRWPEIK
jgi:uncharacterized membrane protein